MNEHQQVQEDLAYLFKFLRIALLVAAAFVGARAIAAGFEGQPISSAISALLFVAILFAIRDTSKRMVRTSH